MAGLAVQFEKACIRLLTVTGFKLTEGADGGVDLVAQNRQGRSVIVDVKLLRAPPTLNVLREIAAQSNKALSAFKKMESRPLLLVSVDVREEHREWLVSYFQIEIWDRSRIRREAEKDEELLAELDDIFAQSDESLSDAIRVRRAWYDGAAGEKTEQQLFALTEYSKRRTPQGQDLCNQLRQMKPGKRKAKDYEQLCVKIVDYLFDDFLRDPRPQNRLEDNLSILDITYRIHPGNLFWDALARDFRARMIVFECKNYNNPIKPDQLYSSERYLSTAGLRSICFMLTRKKPHKHTEIAASGALRETGKLFIFLNDADLCQMLHVRDAQLRMNEEDSADADNAPTVVLDQKIYDFLSRLPR